MRKNSSHGTVDQMIDAFESKILELSGTDVTSATQVTAGTKYKRISHYNEFDNGHVMHNWSEMSDEEAEQLACQKSIEDPKDIYYVEYDDLMNPSSDTRWWNGQSYTYNEIGIRNGVPTILSATDVVSDNAEYKNVRSGKTYTTSMLRDLFRLKEKNGYPGSFEDWVQDMLNDGNLVYASSVTSSTETDDYLSVIVNPGDEEITYRDSSGGFDDIVSLADIKHYWNNNHENDPSLAQYDSFESWFADTRQWLYASNSTDGLLPIDSETDVILGKAVPNQTLEYAKEYLDALSEAIQSEIGSEVDSIVFDSTDREFIVTVSYLGNIHEYVVPFGDIVFDYDNMDGDVAYITNTIYQDLDTIGEDDESGEFTEIASKTVPDSDGFTTDYTMYKNNITGEYVFVFGDKDVYSPEDSDYDYECDSEDEAWEWYNSYNGFDDEDGIYSSTDIKANSYDASKIQKYINSYGFNNYVVYDRDENWCAIDFEGEDEDDVIPLVNRIKAIIPETSIFEHYIEMYVGAATAVESYNGFGEDDAEDSIHSSSDMYVEAPGPI